MKQISALRDASSHRRAPKRTVLASHPSMTAWSEGLNPGRLTRLEVAAGVVTDPMPEPSSLPDLRVSPLRALESEALDLLQRPPCVVAFSGGRDSSALLATFTEVSRRHGLPEPVAVTARWDEDPESNEREWQEQVVTHIGLREWEVLRPQDDLDLLGPVAKDALRRHGLLWPAPAYALLPLMRRAAGGTLVTGEGGDEMFALWPYARTCWKLRHGRRPSLRALADLALGSLPYRLRRRVWPHEQKPYQNWLRPAAYDLFARALTDDVACDPVRWDRYVRVTQARRAVRLSLDTCTRLSAGEGAGFAAPFLAPAFVASLARAGGVFGLGDRSQLMSSIFADLLPAELLSRSTKATFGAVFWGEASRSFADTWDGHGLPEDLVDPELVRLAWKEPRPVYGSAVPLHAAWLTSHSPAEAKYAGGPRADHPLGGISP